MPLRQIKIDGVKQMTNSLIRPAWTPITIAMMIIGFIIAWPLGLAMLAYIIWGDRLEIFKKDINRATDKVADTFKSATSTARTSYTRSGNVAFDEWREAEFERLEEERRKLDEMRAEFDEYQNDLRRARDRKEFDTFLKSRKRKPAPRSKKSGGDVLDT